MVFFEDANTIFLLHIQGSFNSLLVVPCSGSFTWLQNVSCKFFAVQIWIRDCVVTIRQTIHQEVPIV